MADFDLREMPVDKFAEFVQGLQRTPTEASPVEHLPEAARTELLRAQSALQKMRDMGPGPFARRMGVREGAFLDIEKGAPMGVRWNMGLDENQLNQFKMLTDHYGPGNVDLSDDGRFIIRGQKEDFLVDPIGFDKGDVAQMGTQAAPILAGALAARLGLRGKSGIGKVVLGSLSAAGGTALVGAGQDTFVRWLNDNEANLPEIGKRRAMQAVADAALGIIAAGGAKVATKAMEGTLGVFQVPVGSTATKEASKRLTDRTGVKYPLTPGQEAESPFLLKVENVARGRVGSSGAFDAMEDAAQGAEDELRRVFLGLPRTMSDEELMAVLPRADITGQRALAELGKESARVEGAVASATEDILRTGTKEAQELARVNLSSPLVSAEVGRAARTRAVQDFDTFHGEMGARYEDFLSRPEITSRSVSGESLAKAAATMEKKLVPAAETAEGVQTLDAFVPGKVRAFTDTLKQLSQAKVSINDMKQIGTSINNAIKEGISIPGTDVAQLKTLKKGVDDAITDALKGMGDPELLKTWNGLKTDYAAGMSRFDRQGIREMLITEGEQGSIGDTALAESIIGNSPRAADQFNALKSFFGASSPEFESMKQVAREKTLKGSLSDLTGYVDGAILRRQLQNLRPEIAEELFGANKAELTRIGEVLSRAQGKLDTDEILKLAQSKSLTAQKVAALQTAERARAEAYNNKLIKAAARGAIGQETIVPSEFARHVIHMDPTQAAKVMSALGDNPELIQEVRQLAVEDLWGRVRAGKLGHERVSATLLDKAMGDATQQATWRTILGNDTVESLRDLTKTLTSRERNVGSFSGQLGGQMEIAEISLRGEVGMLPEIVGRYFIGFMYSGPMRRMVTNLAASNDRVRLMNAVISSQPFIGGLIDRFGSDGAFVAMHELRKVVEPLQRKELFIQGELQGDAAEGMDPAQLSKEEFKRWLENAAQ